MGGDAMTLGEYINTYLNEHDMSIRQLSRLSGISNTYIGYIINGKKPNGKPVNVSIDKYKKLAKAFGLESASELASYVDDSIAWGSSAKKAKPKAKTEFDYLRDCWDRATYEEKIAVYVILKKYGMPQPVEEDATVSSVSSVAG